MTIRANANLLVVAAVDDFHLAVANRAAGDRRDYFLTAFILRTWVRECESHCTYLATRTRHQDTYGAGPTND